MNVPLPASALTPFSAWSGPRDARLVVVAEAWGREELANWTPLVGLSGMEFFRILRDAGLGPEPLGTQILHCISADLRHYDRTEGFGGYKPIWISVREKWLQEASIAFTNVFNLRPHQNDLKTLTVPRKDPNASSSLPPLSSQPVGYLHSQYLPHLDRLGKELQTVNPNVVVALGATALWALNRRRDIGNVRGTTAMGAAGGPGENRKTLGTFHPSAIIRGRPEWRPVAVADLMKAGRESRTPELIRPVRRALVNPTFEEIVGWVDRITAPEFRHLEMGEDIETGQGMITCIGFSHSPGEGLLIPFRKGFSDGARWHWNVGSPNYWPDAETEMKVWGQVDRLHASGRPIVFQNGMYDMQYLFHMSCDLSNAREDTMLLMHSLYPELQKSLGFLGSLWTNEQSWKQMRKTRVSKAKGEKADE